MGKEKKKTLCCERKMSLFGLGLIKSSSFSSNHQSKLVPLPILSSVFSYLYFCFRSVIVSDWIIDFYVGVISLGVDKGE